MHRWTASAAALLALLAWLAVPLSGAHAQESGEWQLDLDYRDSAGTFGAELPDEPVVSAREVELDSAALRGSAEGMLADPRYNVEQDFEPSLIAEWVNRVYEAVDDFIQRLFGGGTGNQWVDLLRKFGPYLLLMLLLLLLGFVGVRMLVRWFSPAPAAPGEQDGRHWSRSPEEYLNEAEELLQRGRTRRALRQGFNSMLAALSIPYSDRMPNFELSRRVSDSYPEVEDSFDTLLDQFEVVWYGGRIPDRVEVREFLEDTLAVIRRAVGSEEELV